ncbi:tRNA intron endonuclease, putative [Plasmodium malariae]|uniref:tRNA-intron lyase n=1 Tax=Plasmodium malariae TaxID=5858 RepID=A0A1C3L1J2_PLAMA|nr:tRNA intron endonuclease, putative [Plasmodium malariae]
MTNRSSKREIVFSDLSKHFIVLDGIKYGADFVLYKDTTDHEHGFALIFIKEENTTLNHKEKIIISRICESVKKKGIIAYFNENTNTVRYEEILRKKE